MRRQILLCIIILFLNNIIFTQVTFAQTTAEINSFFETPVGPQKKTYKDASQNKNEIELVFSGLFLFYKSFISSQDAISCVFTPSCSEYALIAVKKQGAIIGMMNTFDRLTRCNGFSANNYEKAPNSYLLLDPLITNDSK